MNQSAHDKDQYKEKILDIRAKKIQVWIAALTLISISITTLSSFILIGIDDLKILLTEKPLEGIWQYSSKYENYYDEIEPTKLNGSGKVIIIWKREEKRYDVHVSYGIQRSQISDNSQPLAVLSLIGSLETNDDGWPERNNFKIDGLTIINRLHYKNYVPSLPIYQFSNCELDIKNQRAKRINCDFETPQSKSKISFKWSRPLH